jgi:ribulose-5-phosphate 4-epimerase/fuculose-1-phosphate aldolase
LFDQIAKYTGKLLADRSAACDGIAFAALDDTTIAEGNPQLAQLAGQVISMLNAQALVAARPSLPFADFLVRRAPEGESIIVPGDTETRTFLHDIPFIRKEEQANDLASRISCLLKQRKGVLVEGIGIFALGSMTVEQAYINYSSIFHATFVKYLLDVLKNGFLFADEDQGLSDLRAHWLHPLSAAGLVFRSSLAQADEHEIMGEMAAVGRYTVQSGLVDSCFGNISCLAEETIYISQTGSSLDELEGCIDPVLIDNSSTSGITASSELPAHRRIYETSSARVILHGHPKFAVIMSLLCEEQNCPISDCWKDCPKIRFLGNTPVVAGEIGAGGLAKSVPPVIAGPGRAVVYGHGVFTTGKTGFVEAFNSLVEVENWCREEYFRRIDRKIY